MLSPSRRAAIRDQNPSRTRICIASIVGLLALVASGLWACGDEAAGVRVVQADGDDTSFGEDSRVVVTEDGTFVVFGRSDDCIDIGDVCVDLDEAGGQYCNDDDAQIDVVVVDGEVVDVICYPPDDEGTPLEEVATGDDGEIEVPQTENGSVIVFDESTDGEVIEGNVTLSSERTTLFGNGVDETILGGNLIVASNNSRVRGVTIEGNVEYDENSNNSALSFCRVHGNLSVVSNDFSGLECVVFGNVEVSGNNPVLANIGVGGDWVVTGSGPTCEGCYSVTDDDGDFLVDDGEVGEALICGEAEG